MYDPIGTISSMGEQQQPSLDAPQHNSSFSASWTPSKATALAATNVPLNKIPRGWDREAIKSLAEDGKEKIVWKRYGLRSTHDEEPRADEQLDERNKAENTPGKVVKKLRVGSPVKIDQDEPAKARRRKSAATRYERRKSGYKREFTQFHHGCAKLTFSFRQGCCDTSRRRIDRDCRASSN